jgi:hypothetical protein
MFSGLENALRKPPGQAKSTQQVNPAGRFKAKVKPGEVAESGRQASRDRGLIIGA